MDVVCGRAWSAVVGVSTLVVVLLATRSGGTAAEYLTPGFRPPSVPLVVVDPYLRYIVECLLKYISMVDLFIDSYLPSLHAIFSSPFLSSSSLIPRLYHSELGSGLLTLITLHTYLPLTLILHPSD